MGKLFKKFRKKVSPYVRYVEMRIKIIWYNLHRQHILQMIQKKDKVNVAFFVVNLSMWRCDSLFKLMLDDPRFEPVFVPMPRPMFNFESEKEEQYRLIDYCRQKGYPYISGYDYETKHFNGVDEIKPDLVFFSQPHNAAYPAHKIEALWKKSLFFYVPYCFVIGKEDVLVNNLYLNICQTVFSENEMIKSIESEVLLNKGRNQIVSGYINANLLIGEREDDIKLWKQSSKEIKRIIWAPHHSILEKDLLNYSNFLSIADDMLKLAHDYQGKVQFVFKPHPGLKPKLYDLESWGKERTDNYYLKWANMPNTTVDEGSYDGIFRSSDAMIHDSSSFTVEYLYTTKPVMYISKADHLEYMNSFGEMCYNMHYKGFSIDDVRLFIDDVVICGRDTMKKDREDFVNNYLMTSDGCSTAEVIMNHLVSLCFNKK